MQLLANADTKSKKGTKLTLDDLAPFRMYSWLLQKSERQKTDAWLSDSIGKTAAIVTPAPKAGEWWFR